MTLSRTPVLPPSLPPLTATTAMGASTSREAELSARIVDSIECAHTHTLMLLLKFIVHADPPAAQVARKAAAAANAAAPATASQSKLIANFKPRRVAPAADAAASASTELDPATAAFHARAVALARSQAEAAGGSASVSFPLPLDLNALRLRSGDSLVVGLAKRGDNKETEVAMLRLLAQAGIDLDAQDHQGWTALHHAAALGHTRCLQVLLDAGALTLVHANSGLLASQCSSNPATIALLKERERMQDSAAVQEVVAAAGGAYVGRSLVFEESSSAGFPLVLYRMGCASIIPVAPRAEVAEIEVFFRSPTQRSPGDCICLYYVDYPQDKPWQLRPRIGNVWYLATRRKRQVVPAMDTQQEASSAPAPAAAASSSSVASSSSTASPAAPLSPSELPSLGWDSLSITLKLDSIGVGSSWRFVYFDSIRQAPLAATDVFTIRPAPAPQAPATGGARRASNAGSNSGTASSSSSSGGGGGGGSSFFSFLPSLWGSSSSGGASSPIAGSASSGGAAPPVALHPSFARLSDPSPSNLAAFLSPPPPFFRSHFALNAAAATLALQLDPKLAAFKDRFVAPPHAAAATPSGNAKSGMLRESEFWVRYFYLMSQLPAEPLSQQEHERYQPQRTLVHGQQTITPGARLPQQQHHHLSVQTASSPASSPSAASAATAAAAPASSPVSSYASSPGAYASPHAGHASTPSAAATSSASSVPVVVQAVPVSPAAAAAAAAAAFTAPPVASSLSVAVPAPVRSAIPVSAGSLAAPVPMVRSGPIAAAAAVAGHPTRVPVSASASAGLTPSDDEDDANSGYVPPSFAALPSAHRATG